MTTTYLSNYIQSKSDKLDPNKLIGGKAMQLRNIDSTLVPVWIAITADCPDNDLASVVHEGMWILHEDSPTWCSKLHALKYAVRSSALGEDGEEHSYAGVFESKLNVPITGLEHAVRVVRDSGHSKRVKEYKSGVYSGGQRVAVIIMPMVQAEFSGVLFTKEPLGGTDQMLVEYESGVGGVVDGTSNTEMFFVDTKEYQAGKYTDNHVINWGLPFILNEAKRLENNYRKPLDIEWAIDKDGVAYILQVRPITA